MDRAVRDVEGDVFSCAAFDVDANAAVTIDELLIATTAAIEGCR